MSDAPKFTPGEWTIRERSDTLNIIGGDGKRCIARLQKKLGGVESDAHLIAAAPDLCEAGDAVVDALDQWYDGTDSHFPPDVVEAWMALTKALAKARGEKQ